MQRGSEVQAPLRNGFADGALSRRRRLHELTVTAMFVADKGVATDERYLAHLGADFIKAERQYQRFASVLGHRPISSIEQKRLDDLARYLEQRYRRSFSTDYGWTADALGNPKPTFVDVEAAVDLGQLRPYFRFASNAIHAGPKGTFFRLGVLDNYHAILSACFVPLSAFYATAGEVGRGQSALLTPISTRSMMARTSSSDAPRQKSFWPSLHSLRGALRTSARRHQREVLACFVECAVCQIHERIPPAAEGRPRAMGAFPCHNCRAY